MALLRSLRQRFRARSNLIMLLYLIFAGIVFYLNLAVVLTVSESATTELPNLGGVGLLAAWLWGKISSIYAIFAAVLILRFRKDGGAPSLSSRLVMPSGGTVDWFALVIFVACWQVPVFVACGWISSKYPPPVPLPYGIVGAMAAYSLVRVVLLSAMAVFICRWFGYLGALVVVLSYVLIIGLSYVVSSMGLFPEFASAFMTVGDILDDVLPWDMGFTWPMNIQSTASSGVYNRLAFCILQNLIYACVFLAVAAHARRADAYELEVLETDPEIDDVQPGA